MLPERQNGPARDPEALQREMRAARSDLADSIEQLELAVRQRFDLRRQVLLHPVTSLAVLAITGLGVVLGVRRIVRNRRMQRALLQLSAARQRSVWRA